MYHILMLFLNVVHVRVVYDAGTCQQIDLRSHYFLQTHKIPCLRSTRNKPGECVDKFLFIGQCSAIEQEKLQCPALLMVDLSC